MRGRAARTVFALGSTTLMVAGLAGCNQSSPEQGGGSQSNLKIVEQVRIDQQGAEVKAVDGAAPANPAGDGRANCKPLSIAMTGALTGSKSALGINIANGVKLAVDEHNAANPGCQVQLKRFDTEGDAQKASGIAPQITDDQYTVGLIGPAFSGETKATGTVFDQAGLVSLTASATNPALSDNGWKTFFRGLANDAVQGASVANYLKDTLKLTKICVVDDSSDYGVGLAEAVRTTLGPVANSGCSIQVKEGDKDFSAAVNQVKSVNPDAIFYGGYYSEAAPFVQQLRDAGVQAKFVSADGTKDVEFVKQAGESSRDAILSCPCGPASGAFVDKYTKSAGQPPGTYSAEGYDLGTILLKGIDSGAITRPALLDYVKKYDGQGVARRYQWTDRGELTSNLVWIYKVL